MKFIILSALLTLGFGAQAFAHNPQIHFCQLSGGQFHEIEVNGDQVGYCQFGKAYIDAVSFLMVTTNQGSTTATLAALGGANYCASAGGQVFKGQDFIGAPFDLCFFQDGSSIEVMTLSRGPYSSENALMVQGLSTRY